ncbi:hypothetical protein C2G38_2174678 [Gigaspora rosea]|uniref:J domain-containing protein n=1 Tax=Gigaspora rosea TaxID=44941 RepID=A0A397VQH8_9GLOM|nr:hypothetical protein C2G38_2174678 [Gigaspora rosea]
MDLQAELKKIKSQPENDQLDENEYYKRQKLIRRRWNKLNKAYEILSDNNKCALYDNYDISPELEIMNQTDEKKRRHAIQVYISKAQDYLHKFSIPTILNIYNKFLMVWDLQQKLNSDKVNKMAWQLSQSEISSITREACDNLLNCSHDEKSHLANSLQLLDKV